MTPANYYGELLAMNRAVVTTREAAALWKTSQGTAGRRLSAMDKGGLVRRVRRSLWALDAKVEPFVLAPFLTAPFPAYVSFWSALSRHEMIEQIPRQISIASLDRTKRIETNLGDFEVHHVAPEIFGGYGGSEEAGYLATPEKALFDAVYIRAASSSRAFFPELSLPMDLDRAQLKTWTGRIEAPRLRTLVSRRLREVLQASLASHTG